jgi:subtilisin family serine protease
MARMLARSPKSQVNKVPEDRTGAKDNDETPSRYLVLLQEDAAKQGLEEIRNVSGLKINNNSRDTQQNPIVSIDSASDGVHFGRLNVAVVNADREQYDRLQTAAANKRSILAVERERTLKAINDFSLDYYRGYYDGSQSVMALLGQGGTAVSKAVRSDLPVASRYADDVRETWGLKATRVNQSRYCGRGIRIAILDTGMDQNHPDFAERPRTIVSFIPGESPEDQNGHGTHCIGTALGPQMPASGVRRYGCAFQGEIFVGKVLSNDGEGTDTSALSGIEWAISNGCRVISMSLGSPVRPREPFSVVFETIAQRAIASAPGTIIVAATGNDSNRTQGEIAPAQHPANCPSVFAVGAVGADLGIAHFSNAGANIAGPGMDIFSCCLDEERTIQSGTSMATPHVAGIAALWLEACGQQADTAKLLEELKRNAQRLDLSDVGAGLVQAPV